MPRFLRHRGRSASFVVLTAILAYTWPALAQNQPAEPPATTAPADAAPAQHSTDEAYLRVVEADDGQKIILEAATREFRKDDAPPVSLVAAIHIADRAFYDQLQNFLDSRDVVLFEGVKPPGVGGDASVQGDEAKAKATSRRIRFLAMAIEAYRRENNALPTSIDQLAGHVSGIPADMLDRSLKDLWGRGLVYVVDTDAAAYDIVSLGSDGEKGGEGSAADLKLSDQKPLTKAERGGGGGGIQQQLADAMGLTFQLTAMDHTKANWRNSDMSIDQVQERLEKTGAGGEQLFKLLDGSSGFAKLLTIFLEFVKASPSMQTMLKVVMVEMLSQADELLMAQAGAKMMEVIVIERNAVVIHDLTKVLQDEPAVKTIGIIYGAGHLPDLQRRLHDELGYQPADVTWRPAIEISLKGSGTTPKEARAMREMIRKQIEQQMKSGKRK